MRYQAGLLAGLLSKEIKLVCASLAGAVDRPGSGEYKCTNVVAGDAASCGPLWNVQDVRVFVCQ